jgi:hypothetical protein
MSDLEIVTPRIDHRAEAKRNIQEKILTYLRGGATRQDAAAASGITYETLRIWMQESAFSVSVTMAEGECGALMAARLTAEARRSDGDWKAALAWLQRRRRDEWGDSIKTEISGVNGGPIIISDEVKRQAAEELSAWRKQMSDELQNMQNAPLTQPTCSTTTE